MLKGVNLSAANLIGSDLRDTNLRHADLRGARLNGARLNRAYISNARLENASFRGAVLYETVFSNVVLDTAIGLATCIHKGPSILDHRTLNRSSGLPLEFLRGCGLPDLVIAELTEPHRKKAKYCSCFISYSSRNQDFADQLYADLQAAGIRCWFAPKDIPIGAKLRDAIDGGIRERDKVLLVLSEHAITSAWVEKEVETAFEEEVRRKNIVLFPIRLDETVMEASASWAADIRRARHIGDFSEWENHHRYKLAFAKLLQDLQRETQSA